MWDPVSGIFQRSLRVRPSDTETRYFIVNNIYPSGINTSHPRNVHYRSGRGNTAFYVILIPDPDPLSGKGFGGSDSARKWALISASFCPGPGNVFIATLSEYKMKRRLHRRRLRVLIYNLRVAMRAKFGRRRANENWTSAGKWAIFAWPLLGRPVKNGIECITCKFSAGRVCSLSFFYYIRIFPHEILYIVYDIASFGVIKMGTSLA